LLEVPRVAPGGDDEPGVLGVLLVLPPWVESEVAKHRAARTLVAVRGMLDVDIDRSSRTPVAHHTVIAERVEPVQATDEMFGSGSR
jgi:hypothetical protein